MCAVATSYGRAKMVLVVGEGDGAQAIVSYIVAHSRELVAGEPVTVVGPAVFEATVIRHIREILLPIVNRIAALLELPPQGFELSAVNPGAASASDLGIEISGLSADVPILLAMLSAAMTLAIPDDIASTGHIASSDGDIAAVKALPAKIAAVQADTAVRHFVYPALDRDGSLAVMIPSQTEVAQTAVMGAAHRLRLSGIHNVADLIRTVFSEEAIVMASLQQGFFDGGHLRELDADTIAQAVQFLSQNNESRFWNALERHLLAGDSRSAKRLLKVHCQFHTRHAQYPREVGRRLLQMLRSLPPAIRKLKIEFPLLPTHQCIRLTQYAGPSDACDIRLLYEAAEGRVALSRSVVEDQSLSVAGDGTCRQDESLVDAVVSSIDSAALAQRVAAPIDTARATYMVDCLTVRSGEEFYDALSAFYLHLQRHVHAVSESIDVDSVRAEAIALIERTFAEKGGLRAAMNEALEGVHGGMKSILDAVTEQFKAECQSKHVNRVIKEAISPLDVEAQRCLISVLLRRLKPHLPPEIASAPPERFMEHSEAIVKAYVKSLNEINDVFRRL